MAKLGEGDERWIVDERADGTNVHGWHWQEKDCLPWSKTRLAELLEGVSIVAGEAAVWLKVSKLESCTGEAYVNIRKGKKIPGYEVEVKASWEGEIREGAEETGAVIAKANGMVHLPYISDENADEDPEVKITAAADGPAYSKMRELMVNKGRKIVTEKINQWRTELHAGGPGGDGPAPAPVASPVKKPATSVPEAEEPAQKEQKEAKGTRSIKLTERFICKRSDIYDAYTHPHRIMAFSQSRAESDPTPGGKFVMFDGNVLGENVEMIPGEKIVQKWRFSNWDDGVYSTVSMTIKEPEPGNTVLELVQKGIPEEDKFGNHNVMDQTEHGWKHLIFDRIRHVFGYGC